MVVEEATVEVAQKRAEEEAAGEAVRKKAVEEAIAEVVVAEEATEHVKDKHLTMITTILTFLRGANRKEKSSMRLEVMLEASYQAWLEQAANLRRKLIRNSGKVQLVLKVAECKNKVFWDRQPMR